MLSHSRIISSSPETFAFVYNTAMTVLLGSLAPALFIAMTRYSHSLPRS